MTASNHAYPSGPDGALAEIRDLMADWHHECLFESHTFNGQPLIVVDEDGVASETGSGYFAWPDGTRLGKELPGWPAGHVATPCGRCVSCRLSALGCGLITIVDGQGPRDVSLAAVNEV